ncbi:MAG: PEFG-CTERM sorting domain-containing protein [Nitrosarchaeum sp.]|nr:PEFG-CTERM sorting domain-containing protein [Nitrosarchaeum sp.]
MNVLFLIFILTISSVSFSSAAFAASYDINMPTGSASPDAPFFWQNEKSGLATGDIDISVGDTVVWQNADTAKHTITSGTVEDGPDGIFGGSNFISPGQSYKFTFTQTGQFPYYCLIHPWMTGTVFVTDGTKIINQVGKTVGDGSTTFNVEYLSDRLLTVSAIDEDQKSITFEIIGNAKSDDGTLKIKLHSDLIDGPFVIFIDGKKITDFDDTNEDDISTVTVVLPNDAKLLTIIGTSVVPEFGVMSIVILAVATTIIMFASQKSGFKIKL